MPAEYDDLLVRALELHKRWRNRDPFPSIAPALLNRADILDYVNATGMVVDFDASRLKDAAYKMVLHSEIWYWDERRGGEYYKKDLEDGSDFVIQKNSIVFVRPKERFLLPSYIALRFNLDVGLVHKGMLLGTGPLINPGYCGELMIPLHNLVSVEHTIKIGKPIISVEFTKLSPNIAWNPNYAPCLDQDLLRRSGVCIISERNDLDKATFAYYRSKALGNNVAIRSALIDAMSEFEKKTSELQKSLDESKKVTDRFSNLSIIGTVVFFVTLMGTFLTNCQFVQDNKEHVTAAVSVTDTRISIIDHNVRSLEEKLNSLKVSVDEQKSRQANKQYR